MGLLADSLRERGLVGPSEQQPAGSTFSTGVTGEFAKGLNSGLTGIGGGLRAMAGTVGEALGADEFAQSQYTQARAAQTQAQREAPRVTSYKDVGSLRDAVHYGAGLLGGSAPSIAVGAGAALATGGGAIPGLIAGALAQTPIEAGDVAMKQLDDPEAMATGAGERSLRQLGGGLVSAGLQSVVPNMLAGKIAGRTAGEAAKKTTGQIVRSNLAAVPQEGFFEGASDALKQTAANENRDLDWDSITESAVGGAVAGGAMSTVGAGAEILQSAPTKSWIGAKGMAQDALRSTKDTLDPIWADIKPSVDAGVAAMRSGAANAWEAMPESVKGAGEFLKTSFEDQTADAVAALKRIKEADDIPAEIKKQAMESGKALGLAANRAYVWSVDQTRGLAGKAKDAAPEDIGSRLRGLTTPKDDTVDRVAAGMPIGDEDPSIPGAVERGDAKAAEWAKTKGAELLNRTGLSDEKKAQLTQALGDVTDQANRAVVASIAKGTEAFDALSRRVNKAYEGMKAGIEQKRAEGGTKKSEDYSGFERQVVERAVPILQESHPELFEAEGAKVLARVGKTISMFVRAAADGQTVRMKTLNGVVEDMLGKDTAHQVLDSMYSLIEGNEDQVNNFYKVRAEMDAEAKTREPLEAILAKFSTNEAAERSGINSDPKEWASFLRDWAHGRLTEGMPSAKAAFEDERVRTAVTKHFGTKAKNILAALDREVEQTHKDSGVGKNQFDSDEAIAADNEQDSEEKDVESRYLDASGEGSESPKLYDHPDLAKGKAGFKSATQQALNRFRTANPDSRVYFVPLRDYAKAHNLSEEEMHVLSGGADPSEVGYVKAERIKDDDSLRPNEIRRMTMASKFVKNKRGVMNPDAINVPGTTTNYDSKRIANVMHNRSKDEWSEAERATGWEGRMARKFTEGIAALSAMHGKNLEVRDDQVIATSGGKDLTWGEAKKGMAKTDTSSLPDFLKNATKGELKLHEIIPDLSDTELKSSITKVTDARDAILEPIEAQIKEEVADEMGKGKYGSNKADQIYREVRKRVKQAMQDESTGLPKLVRLLQGLEYEQDKRSGEDRRSMVMDTASESRQGIALGKVAVREAEGKQYRAEERGGAIKDGAAFGVLTKFLGGIDPRVEAQNAQLDATDKTQGLGMTGEAPGVGSGRTEGDPDGNIHDSAATMSAKDLERNTQELSAKFPDVKEILSRAALIMESESPMRQKLYDRVVKLAMNSAAMSGKDRDVLLESARRDSIVEFNSVVNDMARKYADRIVAPGAKAEPKADLTKVTLDKYREYITNPPEDFDIDRAKEIAAWAKEQEERLTKKSRALEKEGGDEYDRLDGLRFDARMLKEKANEVVKNESGRLEIEREGTPDPKAVAAKKAAFLERAVSGDKDLIKELSTSDDAKGLQRAVEALYDVRGADAALQAANTRLGELVAGSPDVAYGMGIKKYSLESGQGETDGRARLITRLAGARRSEFAHADEAEVFIRSEGKVSFGPVQGGTKFFFSDSRSTHAYVVAPEHLAAIKYNLKVKPLERHADVLAYFAVQHAFLDRSTGEFQSFTSHPSSPTGKWLESQDAVEPTGEFFGDGVTPINRVVGVTARQNSDFLADALAYAKHIEKSDQIYVDWERITGARKGKRGSGMFDATQATGTPLTAKGREQIKAYLRSTTPWASVAFPNMSHAGEFTMEQGEAVVRVSAHALNPTSVAYHESLHAFFQHLNDGKMADVIKTVMQTASKPAVTARLRELLAHSPEARAQLKDAEERAAYMYQFWAQGDEKLIAAMGEKSTTFFGKLADYFRKLLGVWSNDERALHILEYFSSGEYGANVGKPDAAYEAMMETGRNAALDKLGDMAHSFMEMGEAVWGAGSANLRDSGIPALAKIADLVKRKSTDEGTDAGYLPAARIARAEYLDKLANTIGSVDEAVAHEALEALQAGTTTKGVDAERVRIAVRATLDDMYGYLTKAGVRVNDMGLGKDYFPRRWDATYLSKNKQKFLDMARNYPEWHNPEATFNRLVSADGSEMPIVERPGMASKQERLLSFISAEDAAPFMSKNLYQIMNSYVSQATRRAEWARRFTDTNEVLEDLLSQATKQGATAKQIDEAKRFVQGVNGTLGDNINPNLRRYMGNMMVYQNLRLLPLAVFSSVVDPMGLVVRGGSVGQAWKTFTRAIREVPAGLKGQEVQDYWTDMAETLGVIESATLNNALGSLYLQGAVGDTARRINDKFFRFNLMEQFNRSMHVGATEAAVKFLMKHKDLKGPHSARYLAELGLKPSDIQITGGRVKLTTAEGLTEAQAAKIKSAVNMWVDGAILRPDAADKPVWMNDPKYMLVAHLKQFVYAFQHTILARTVHEFKHGNAGPALALTSYVPFMLIADGMKDFLVNAGDEPEWKKAWGPGQYLANSVERAGLLGVGQFGVDTLTGRAGTLTGPTIEQLGEAVQVGGGNKQFKSMFIHSMPANAVYAPMLKAGRDEHFHPGE